MTYRNLGAVGMWLGVLISWKMSGGVLNRHWNWTLVGVAVPVVAVVGWYLGGEEARRRRRRHERLRL